MLAKRNREIHRRLLEKRSVAIRRGILVGRRWAFKADSFKALIDGAKSKDDLLPEDVEFDLRQKQVDMKLGLDVASMAYKKLVDNHDCRFPGAAAMGRQRSRENLGFPRHAEGRPALAAWARDNQDALAAITEHSARPKRFVARRLQQIEEHVRGNGRSSDAMRPRENELIADDRRPAYLAAASLCRPEVLSRP